MLGPFYTGDTPGASFEVHVQRDGADIALDPYSDAEVLLYKPDGTQGEWDATPAIDDAEDIVTIEPPASSPFPDAGLYAMYLRLTLTAGGVETFFVDDVRVFQLGAAIGWATSGQVRAATGETVTDADTALAQDVVEIHAGRTFAGSSTNSSIRAKDLAWLSKAVIYQAAWMVNQPGYLNRHTVKEVNQDGAQIIYAGSSEPSNPALIMLAPLANRALKNLSWMGTRSITFKPQNFEGEHPSYGDYKRNDEHGGWRPL